MKRVLHFVEGLSRGGIETFVMNACKSFDVTKISASILALKRSKTGEDQYFIQDALRCDIPVQFLLDENYEPSQSQIKRYIDYTKIFRDFVCNNKAKYDWIHIHASNLQNMYPYIRIILKETNWRIVLHSHSSSEESSLTRVIHNVFRSMLPQSRMTFLACSQPAGEWMFGRKKFQIVKNGIPLSQFVFRKDKRAKVRAELGLPGDMAALCHIGRFDAAKNHSFMLMVFRAFHEQKPNSRLYLIGDGKGREGILDDIRKLALEDSVVLLGVRTDVYELINAMDCLVFPSLYEGLSIALVEAQVNRIPVVASNRIAEETKMTSMFQMLDIAPSEQNIQIWANTTDMFVRKGREENEAMELLEEYDITAVAKKLERIYGEN